MNKPNKKSPLFPLRYFILVLFVFLTACDSNPDNPVANTVSAISGDVLDGPIKNGILEVRDANNKIVATSRTDERGGYSVDLPDDAKRPLIIFITGGIDIVTDHPLGISLKSIITADNLTASDKNININAFSSLVVVAYQMFAENDAGDINVATNHVMQAISFGLNPNANPITTAMDKDNVADFIKANEAAIEFVRRLSVASGKSMVKTMIALSEDLSDGIIDGKAATGINPTQLTEAFAKQARIIQINIISELINNSLKITDEAGFTLVSADESAVKLNTAIKINQVDAGDEQSIENIVVTDELNKELLDAIAEVELYSDEDLASSDVSLNDDIDLEQLKKTAAGIKTISITGPSAVLEGEPLLTGVLGEIGPEVYIVSIDVAPTADTTVMLIYSGTASEGVDYTSVDSVLIGAGNTSATFGLTTHSDDLLEGTETMIVSISSISHTGTETIVTSSAKQQIITTINDTSPLTVSLAGPISVLEGSATSTYTVSIDQAPTTDTSVALSYSGTASDGSDYSSISSVLINAATTSTTFILTTISDFFLEVTETIIVGLSNVSHAGAETIIASSTNQQITTVINDTSPLTVSLAGSTSVLEGNTTSIYTVSIDQAPSTDTTVTLNFSGTATVGIDYTSLGSVLISAGSLSTAFTLSTLADALLESNETLIVSLGNLSHSGMETLQLGSSAQVETTINDSTDLSMFTDSALRTCVIDTLESQGLTQLLEITLLDCSNLAIINLAGVDQLGALSTLNLSSNQIIDISAVSSLVTLTSLDLSNNQVIDISAISSLMELASLDLSNNQIIDISAVSSLATLTSLDLSSNQIDDIQVSEIGSPLDNLTVLTDLNLSDNQISYIWPISSLTTLASLNLSGNQIIDISAVSSLSALTTLNLRRNQIIDISAVAGLTTLNSLDLFRNQIIDISPVLNLTALSTLLSLGDNQISDISPISGLAALTTLYLDGNFIIDILPVSNLTELNILYLFDNQISDISPLSGLTNLTTLYLQTNQIFDITILSILTNLLLLDLTNNCIIDFSPLSGLSNTTITGGNIESQNLQCTTPIG